jgi:nitroreductase
MTASQTAAAVPAPVAPTAGRTPDHEVMPLLVERWSPRAMSGAAVSHEELMRLLEAARWAPSGGNQQPWRFVYATAGTPGFTALFESLMPLNRAWAGRAGALVLVASQSALPDGRPLSSHAFDAGAAWMALALQGASMGLSVHAMGGIDREQAAAAVALPAGHVVHAIVAVGRPGDPAELPEALRARELQSSRKKVEEFAFDGRFPG